MGQFEIEPERTDESVRTATRALLTDLAALEQMLSSDLFERGVHRIGAEQELFLVDASGHPASVAPDLLAELADEPRAVPELARFNLEINLTPQLTVGRPFTAMEVELRECLDRVRARARGLGARPLMCGILPTLRLSDLTLVAMMPVARYRALNEAVRKLHGSAFRCHILGLDEIDLAADSLMLEAANTSFQVHFQVSPEEFAQVYNAAQLAAGPVLAAAVNSPLLFGKRLWAETRVAVFQHSIDARSQGQQQRGHPSRVDFGGSWVRNSVLELFREDASRFRVLLPSVPCADPMDSIRRGIPPDLAALRLFNGTVYRWNRPCYGVSGGRAHLRIEARALPAGPSVVDEVANAAFLTGLLGALPGHTPDIAATVPFEHARGNFFAAARFGLDAQLRWPGLGTLPAQALILDHLLPLARTGLGMLGVDPEDVDAYLPIIEERVRSGRTGAAWTHASLHHLTSLGVPPEQHPLALATASLAWQETGEPVHRWDAADAVAGDSFCTSYRTVGQFMTTDLRTVRPDDLVDLAAALMDWVHVRHIPVEDEHGRLVGILSNRAIVRLFAKSGGSATGPVLVSTLMTPDPIAVSPDTPTLDAVRLLREKKIGCLPIVDGEKLVGIVTEHDFIRVAQGLLEERLGES